MSNKTIRYTGEILNCVKHGAGVYKYPESGIYSYEGSWDNGEKHGNDAAFHVSGCSSYEGEFQRGEISGIGKKKWEDGRSYEGEWYFGEMHGKGVWTSADEQEVYEGEFRDNKRDGMGYLKIRNGDTYKGYFSLHKYHGEGDYLRENCYFVAANFNMGLINGHCNIQWHKIASYVGSCENGVFQGKGHFTALDGSYEYNGPFLAGSPCLKVEAIDLSLDRSNCVQDTDGKKDKKKKPAAKKGVVDVDPVGTVPTGDDLGRLIVTLRCSTGEDADTASAVTSPAGVTIPICNELRRLMRVRLRQYILPPPPAKGAAVESPDPDSEMGEVVPLWLRSLTIEERSTAWERFPLHSLRYINGMNPLTGETIALQGGATDFSSVAVSGIRSNGEGDGGVTTSNEELIVAAGVTAEQQSCVAVMFSPLALAGASEQMSYLADWKLDPTVTRTHVDINGKVYGQSPVLSLSHIVDGLEGSGRLDLLLLAPQAEEVANKPWSDCVWELRLSEARKAAAPPSSFPSAEQAEDDDKAHSTVPSIEEKVTVLCRWADASEFDPFQWHSIALTIRTASSDATSTPLVDLTVDGSGRMKLEGSSGNEGVAAAWLPAEAAGECPVDGGGDYEVGESPSVQVIYRVGFGTGFAGYVKNMVVCTSCDPQQATACFSAWYSSCLSRVEKDAHGGLAGEGDPSAGLEVAQEVSVLLVGGRGVLQGVVVPKDTATGVYVLEVLDAVSEACLQREVTENPVTDAEDSSSNPPAVERMEAYCCLAARAGSSKSCHKLIVE